MYFYHGRQSRICKACGAEFGPVCDRQEFCHTCSAWHGANTWRRRQQREQARHKTCLRCGAEFVARRSDARYCSDACRQARYRYRRCSEDRAGNRNGTKTGDTVTDNNGTSGVPSASVTRETAPHG